MPILSHGIRFFGSFLSIQNEFKLNIYDDIRISSYESDFFHKNKNEFISNR